MGNVLEMGIRPYTAAVQLVALADDRLASARQHLDAGDLTTAQLAGRQAGYAATGILSTHFSNGLTEADNALASAMTAFHRMRIEPSMFADVPQPRHEFWNGLADEVIPVEDAPANQLWRSELEHTAV